MLVQKYYLGEKANFFDKSSEQFSVYDLVKANENNYTWLYLENQHCNGNLSI